MSYITREYLEQSLGCSIFVSGALTFGNTSSAVTGSVFTNLEAEAASWVDSFIEGSGQHRVPLETPPAVIKQITSYKCLEGMYFRMLQPIPQVIQQKLDANTGWLMSLKNGDVSLPGIPDDPTTALGGHSFTESDSTVTVGTSTSDVGSSRIFDRDRLRNSFG